MKTETPQETLARYRRMYKASNCDWLKGLIQTKAKELKEKLEKRRIRA